MSNFKKFKISDDWREHEVTLSVDLDLLTVELANEINGFFDSDDYRLSEENNDPVRAVIRMAGQRLINEMLSAGGNDFGETNKCSGSYWTKWLGMQEGWAPDEITGIRCIEASVFTSDYDDLSLKEIS